MKIKNSFLKVFLTIFFVILTGTSAFAGFSFKNMCLKVVQISDSHISDREDTSYKLLSASKDILKDAIAQVNEIKGVDFVMFTGDMVDQPFVSSYKDFFTILADLNYPSLMAFGNHDRVMCTEDSGCTDGLTKKEALEIIKKCNRNYIFEDSYYAFSPKTDYRIIVLDPTIDDEVTSNGYLPQKQLDFLDNEINANQDKVIVIFMHHPALEPFVSEHHQIRNADDFLMILKKYKNPILVATGHYHATKIVQDKNIIHVSSPSLVTYPNAFRLINITNYRDRTVFEFSFYETNLKDKQEISKQSTIAATSFSGRKEDKIRTIVYKKPHVKKEKKAKQEQEDEMIFDER